MKGRERQKARKIASIRVFKRSPWKLPSVLKPKKGNVHIWISTRARCTVKMNLFLVKTIAASVSSGKAFGLGLQ